MNKTLLINCGRSTILNRKYLLKKWLENSLMKQIWFNVGTNLNVPKRLNKYARISLCRRSWTRGLKRPSILNRTESISLRKWKKDNTNSSKVSNKELTMIFKSGLPTASSTLKRSWGSMSTEWISCPTMKNRNKFKKNNRNKI